MEELIIIAKEIIDLSDFTIKDNRSPNLEVIKIIKREFEKQYDSLTKSHKVIVLNNKRDLWASRTIIDSADFEYDKVLFDKVFEFAKLCMKLKRNELVILY